MATTFTLSCLRACTFTNLQLSTQDALRGCACYQAYLSHGCTTDVRLCMTKTACLHRKMNESAPNAHKTSMQDFIANQSSAAERYQSLHVHAPCTHAVTKFQNGTYRGRSNISASDRQQDLGKIICSLLKVCCDCPICCNHCVSCTGFSTSEC